MKSITTVALLLVSLLLFPLASADVYDDAVANPARPEADRERDMNTHPAALLRFAGVKAGDTVVDLFSGGGYNAELLAAIVGPAGKVYMHNNAGYRNFAGDAIAARGAGARLRNVEKLDAEIESVPLPDNSADVIWINMSYHDAYWVNEGWTVTADKFFPTVKRILKPGGAVIVIDHIAPIGSGSSLTSELHRIDPAFARTEFVTRGFRFVASSDMLANPNDPLDIGVFDPSIQGKTSRFVYKFTK